MPDEQSPMNSVTELKCSATAPRPTETDDTEFKSGFDRAAPGSWCEVVKDIAAMANSEGGSIVFGLTDQGHPSGEDLDCLASIDIAEITDQVQRYSHATPPRMTVSREPIGGHDAVVLRVWPCAYPLVFDVEGSYRVGKKTKCAFRKGAVYVRRSGKSEPIKSTDLRAMIDRAVDRRNAQLRQVIEAPLDSRVVIAPADAGSEVPDGVQLSTDPAAPTVRISDDALSAIYPHDYNSLTRAIRARVPGFLANQQYHDARKALEPNPTLCHVRCLSPGRPSGGTKKLYSEEMVARVIEVFDNA